jgi:PII-like signaling protein
MTADRRELAAIFAGGAVGAGARTALVEAAPTVPGHWPWVTFAVNVAGCVLLGYLVTRQLLAAGAAGATVLRGARGFYGDREPFADRFLALRRNAPVHVVLVDQPANVRRWWPVVDRLTCEAGLVTSELVPAAHAVKAGPLALALADTRAR